MTTTIDKSAAATQIKYWINAIPKTSCALFNSLADIEKGSTLVDIVSYATGIREIPHVSSNNSWNSAVSAVINFLAEHFGWRELPSTLKEASFPSRLNSKNADEFGPTAAAEAALALLEFLREHSLDQNRDTGVKSRDDPVKQKPKPRVSQSNSPHYRFREERPPEPSNINNNKASTRPYSASLTASYNKRQTGSTHEEGKDGSSNNSTPNSAKKRIHFDDSATQYHTVPARGMDRYSMNTEESLQEKNDKNINSGEEFMTYPAMNTKSDKYSIKNEKRSKQPPPPSSEEINVKYKILNQDPEPLINHPDLDLVFSSAPTGRRIIRTKSPKRPSSTSAIAQRSQRQQYMQKKTQLLNRRKHIQTANLKSSHDSLVSDTDVEDKFDEGITDLDKTHLLQFLSKELGVRARPSYSTRTDDTNGSRSRLDLKDEWSNGVMLSEVAASLLPDDKDLVKEVFPPSVDVSGSFDGYKKVVNLSKIHDTKPRLLLRGTELIVKGKAQAIRNTQLTLKTLSSLKPRHFVKAGSCPGSIDNLQDLELILPEDLVLKRRSAWPIVMLIYRSFRETPKDIKRKSPRKPRSVSAPPVGRGDSLKSPSKQKQVPLDKPPPRRPDSAIPQEIKNAQLQKCGEFNPVHHAPQVENAVQDLSHRAATEMPGETARRQIRSASSPPSKSRPRIANLRDKELPHAQVTDNIYEAVNEVSKSLNTLDSRPKPRRRRNLYQSEPVTAHELEIREKNWNDSWNSQRDREPLWDITNSTKLDQGDAPSRRVSNKTMLSAAMSRAKLCNDDSNDVIERPKLTSDGVYKQKNKHKQRWYPPDMIHDDIENLDSPMRNAKANYTANQASLAKLPPIFPQQQLAIKNWLYSLGLSVREGEGGFVTTKSNTDLNSFHNISTKALHDQKHYRDASAEGKPPPPAESAIVPLKEDRLRNGVLLCELINILEPNASRHAQLLHLVRYQPINVQEAMENIQRALWLLRIRKSPPIPVVYLSNPKGILEANRAILWGLLGEMMQVYPVLEGTDSIDFSNRSGNGSSSVIRRSALSLSPHVPMLGGSGRLSKLLPYSIEERRILDASLMHWLVEEDVISGISKTCHPAEMPSLLSLESSLRDGTLFCLLVGKITGTPVIGWTRRGSAVSANRKSSGGSTSSTTLSMRVQVSNMEKCLRVLRAKPLMSTRFLYSGVEEDVVRGEWNAILGLMEDLHRYRDRHAPRGSNVDGKEKPYLGQDLPMNWPPPLTCTENDSGDVPTSAPRLPSFLEAKNSGLNYYVVPDQNGDNINKADLRLGKTTADVVAFENQPVRKEPSHHYPKPDGSHNATLLTEEYLLDNNENSENDVQSASSTDVKLSDAINASSWKTTNDLYPTSNIPSDSPTSLNGSQVSDDSLQSEENKVKKMRQKFQHQRRPVDIIPGKLHGNSVDPISIEQYPSPQKFNDSESNMDPDSMQFYHYKPPEDWHDGNGLINDIQPLPSNIPGGMSLNHSTSADLVPKDSTSGLTLAKNKIDIEKTMTCNTRPTDLRVMTAMSRDPKQVTGRRAPPHNKDDVNSNSRDDVDEYEWVRKMKDEENKRVSEMKPVQFMSPGHDNVYDDHISVTSTPPTNKTFLDQNGSGGGGKTARQLKNLRDNKLMQGATAALRWISSLQIPNFALPIMSPLDGIQPDGSFQLPLFSDGVIFCKVFATLARDHKPVPGLCEKPHTKAQNVQNVRRFLDLLTQTNKTLFPVHVKSYEEDIVNGRGDVIVDLLLRLKECYKHVKGKPRHPRHSL